MTSRLQVSMPTSITCHPHRVGDAVAWCFLLFCSHLPSGLLAELRREQAPLQEASLIFLTVRICSLSVPILPSTLPPDTRHSGGFVTGFCDCFMSVSCIRLEAPRGQARGRGAPVHHGTPSACIRNGHIGRAQARANSE